jgi:copper chaperone CopZ
MTTTTMRKASAKAILSLFNLGCPSCSGIVERELKKLPGIENVAVNYATDVVVVDYDPSTITSEAIRSFMKKIGHDTSTGI